MDSFQLDLENKNFEEKFRLRDAFKIYAMRFFFYIILVFTYVVAFDIADMFHFFLVFFFFVLMLDTRNARAVWQIFMFVIMLELFF